MEFELHEDRAVTEPLQRRPVIAVAYYRPPSPPQVEWEQDFANIAATGFDAVKLWLYWGWHERSPGTFDWSESDLFFDLAEKNGLAVIPNILLELPPSWREIEHALCTPAGPVNVAHFPSLNIPCFDDPALRSDAENFVINLVQRYAHRRIVHWDVWNEPRSRWDCICPASQTAYANWLEKEYGSVETYNQRFGKCFHSWGAVASHVTGSDWADEFNWRMWAGKRLAAQVHWVADLVRRHDQYHPVMAHVGICSPLQYTCRDTSFDVETMAGLDFYGSSCDASWESQWYTTGADNVKPLVDENGLLRLQLQVDWMRSLSRNNWICELYGNHYNAWVTRTEEQLMWQFWQCLARDLAGVIFWEYKVERIGIESLGYGIVGLDGKPNARLKAIHDAIGLIRGNLASFFATYTLMPPKVGILFDERSSLLSEMDMARNACLPQPDLYRASLWGAYGSLRSSNIPVQWLPHQWLGSRLDHLQFLLLPGPSYLTEDMTGYLADFVANGGTLIGLAGTGYRAENTWVSTLIPGSGLSDLFGVHETLRSVIEGEWPLFSTSGNHLGALAHYRVDLAIKDAAPIAVFADGKTAVTCRDFGAGRAIYVAGHLGVDGADCQPLLKHLALTACTDDWSLACAEKSLDTVPWKADDCGAWFVFNTGTNTCRIPAPAERFHSLFGNAAAEQKSLLLPSNSAALVW